MLLKVKKKTVRIFFLFFPRHSDHVAINESPVLHSPQIAGVGG